MFKKPTFLERLLTIFWSHELLHLPFTKVPSKQVLLLSHFTDLKLVYRYGVENRRRSKDTNSGVSVVKDHSMKAYFCIINSEVLQLAIYPHSF